MLTDSPSRSSWILAWATLALAGCLLAASWVPAYQWESLPDLCLFHRLTGLACPTCGLTRSWSALVHGHLRLSLHYHALGATLLLGVALWLGWWWARSAVPSPPRLLWWVGGFIWAGYCLGRMAGLWPGP